VSEIPEGVERWPNGDPVVVVRPLNVNMTLTLAKIAHEHQNEDALKEAISGGPVSFLGFLTKRDGKMFAIWEGEDPVPVDAGDILAGLDQLRKPD
jgi:hypothetical protein